MLSNQEREEIAHDLTVKLAKEIAKDTRIVLDALTKPGDHFFDEWDKKELKRISAKPEAVALLVAELGRRRDFASKQSL